MLLAPNELSVRLPFSFSLPYQIGPFPGLCLGNAKVHQQRHDSRGLRLIFLLWKSFTFPWKLHLFSNFSCFKLCPIGKYSTRNTWIGSINWTMLEGLWSLIDLLIFYEENFTDGSSSRSISQSIQAQTQPGTGNKSTKLFSDRKGCRCEESRKFESGWKFQAIHWRGGDTKEMPKGRSRKGGPCHFG